VVFDALCVPVFTMWASDKGKVVSVTRGKSTVTFENRITNAVFGMELQVRFQGLQFAHVLFFCLLSPTGTLSVMCNLC